MFPSLCCSIISQIERLLKQRYHWRGAGRGTAKFSDHSTAVAVAFDPARTVAAQRANNSSRAEPELMYPDQKIEECHSDRSRAKRGEVEEPFVWKLKTKGGSTSLAMTAPGWNTSSSVAL
jgi:hypothetical protein